MIAHCLKFTKNYLIAQKESTEHEKTACKKERAKSMGNFFWVMEIFYNLTCGGGHTTVHFLKIIKLLYLELVNFMLHKLHLNETS